MAPILPRLLNALVSEIVDFRRPATRRRRRTAISTGRSLQTTYGLMRREIIEDVLSGTTIPKAIQHEVAALPEGDAFGPLLVGFDWKWRMLDDWHSRFKKSSAWPLTWINAGLASSMNNPAAANVVSAELVEWYCRAQVDAAQTLVNYRMAQRSGLKVKLIAVPGPDCPIERDFAERFNLGGERVRKPPFFPGDRSRLVVVNASGASEGGP